MLWRGKNVSGRLHTQVPELPDDTFIRNLGECVLHGLGLLKGMHARYFLADLLVLQPGVRIHLLGGLGYHNDVVFRAGSQNARQELTVVLPDFFDSVFVCGPAVHLDDLPRCLSCVHFYSFFRFFRFELFTQSNLIITQNSIKFKFLAI